MLDWLRTFAGRGLLVAVTAATWTACARSAALQEFSGITLAITDVTVIDGTGASPTANETVLIRGNRIVSIGNSRSTRVPAGTPILEGRGRFLIPGLWDMHVHLKAPETYADALLANGVTGVRDLGSPTAGPRQWRNRFDAGEVNGPRIVYAGAVLDGSASPVRAQHWLAVTKPASAIRAVDSLANQGADFIKVYHSLKPDVFAALMGRANERGIPVAGHVPGSVNAVTASRLGLRSIEHMTGLLLASSSAETELRRELVAAGTNHDLSAWFVAEALQAGALLNSYDSTKAQALFEHLRDNGTAVVPTLAAQQLGFRTDDLSFTQDPRLRHMAERDRSRYLEPRRYRGSPSFASLTDEQRLFELRLKMVGDMHRAGVTILAGTDTPSPFLVPGYYLVDELELLVCAGLTPMAALQAATSAPARFLGVADSLGTVQTGKIADLVVLDENPAADVRAVSRVHAVVMNGKIVKTPTRHALSR